MQTIETEQTDRPIFKPSAETERIIELLKRCKPNDVVTWADLREYSRMIETSDHYADKQKLRACLSTARKHLLTEDQACFAAVRGIGIKRLPPGDVVEQEGTTANRVRRVVRASMRRLSTVKPETLEPAALPQYRMTSAALGAIALCVKASSLAEVKQVTMGGREIDGKAALALFAK